MSSWCCSLVAQTNSGGLVFVDEAAEEVATPWVIRAVRRRRVSAVWRGEIERPVRPVLVLVAAVDAEDVVEVASAEDEHSVEAV